MLFLQTPKSQHFASLRLCEKQKLNEVLHLIRKNNSDY